MADKAISVTDAEFAVLEVLWERESATIREMCPEVYPRAAASDYATVQKLLARLEAKGCVARDRSSFAHVFRAAISRADLIGQRLQVVAEKLCDGSLTPLLMHLARATRLSAEDREALRRLLDEPGSPPPK